MLVEIKMLNWVVEFFMPVVLFYRRVRYGYAFRRIRLTEGKYAIVDAEDYENISRYCWQLDVKGYAWTFEHSTGKSKMFSMHRLACKAEKGVLIDHVNRNRLDNRKANLRPATHSQNAHHAARRAGASKYRGVQKVKNGKKWRVRFCYNYKQIHVGYFDDEIAAAKAYDEAVRKYFGEFAVLNFEK